MEIRDNDRNKADIDGSNI